MHDAAGHIPVLSAEALHYLNIDPAGTYVDCTAGGGGHSELIAERLTTGRLIALDRDPEAVERVQQRLAPYPAAQAICRNYAELGAALAELNIESVEGILVDAGLSSCQLDDARRGFSLQAEGPLDMRMDATRGGPAAAWLREQTRESLMQTLRTYGDVRPARRIAETLVARAHEGRLNTTGDLRQAVCDALPFVHGEPDEVRTVFQAIRIAVNDELNALRTGLAQMIDALAPGGRLAVISFHSGEDRIVKQAFRSASRVQRELFPDGRVAQTYPPRLRVLTPRPVSPSEAERRANPRAHSARLRAAERLPEEGGPQ